MTRFFVGGAVCAFAAMTAAPVWAQSAKDQPQRDTNQPGATAERAVNAAPISESYPSVAIGDGTTTAGYNQSRWVEDWTKYRDPAKRDDFLDSLKYIPIAADGDVYATLAGEARLRMNLTTNPNLRDSEAQRQDILRLSGSADIHLGKHVRVFGELAHGGLDGVNLGTPAATLKNDLVVQQSFVDVTGEIANLDLGIRYGRQTFSDGSQLLVVPRDNNTILFTYNGVRAWARSGTARIDIFDFKPTQLGSGGTGDDLNSDGRRFSGISTGFVLPETLFGKSKLFFDPFVWRLRDNSTTWGPNTGREVRNFYGVHTWGDIGPVNIDWMANHQEGSFDGRDLSAWMVTLAQTYRLGEGRTAPRVGLHADYASGGGSYGTGTLKTALAPFGNNIYYSYQLFATLTNFVAVAPSFSFSLFDKARVTAEYQLSWRDTNTDAVYRANGTPFTGTELIEDKKIADTARLQLVYPITSRLSFTGRYEHLMAGPSLEQAGYKNSDFLAGWISFRF